MDGNMYQRSSTHRDLRQRSTKSKSLLKRSKSLHTPKQQNSSLAIQSQWQYNKPSPINQMNGTRHNGSANGHVQSYASRRHHSTNDYSLDHTEVDSADLTTALILRSSSHNLYYQFQNLNLNHHNPNSSSSSGASLVSLSESTEPNSPKSLGNKPLDYYEDSVFVESTNNHPHHQHQNGHSAAHGAAKINSLTNGNWDGANGSRKNSFYTSKRHGSSSNTSVVGGGSNDHCTLADQFDLDRMADYVEDKNSWDEFTLEQLPEGKPLEERFVGSATNQHQPKRNSLSNNNNNSGNGNGSNTTARLSKEQRFYIVKQRNYPPMYLENKNNHRRIYRVLILGYPSSGKSSLLEQFQAYLAENEHVQFNPTIDAQLNNCNNMLIHFLKVDSFDKYLLNSPIVDYQPDAYLILYSVNNRDSFNLVKKLLIDLQRWDDIETKSVIIVANKSDLVRCRCVSQREGREFASANNCKYIEISCTISHNIGVLLHGIGAQISLKEKQLEKQRKKELELMNSNKTTSTSGAKLRRKPSFFKRILQRTAISKSKSCDNLHVL